MSDCATGIDWQTWIAIAAAVFSGGSLLVAGLSLIHTRKASRENAAAATKAQETADRAIQLREEANAIRQDQRHADVLPALAFAMLEVGRTPRSLWFQNSGRGPAHAIQIDAVVADDCPPDRRQGAEEVIRQWVKQCDRTTMNPGDTKPIASTDAMLRFVEVRRLTFEDEYRKRFARTGRAHDMRPVGESAP